MEGEKISAPTPIPQTSPIGSEAEIAYENPARDGPSCKLNSRQKQKRVPLVLMGPSATCGCLPFLPLPGPMMPLLSRGN